MVATVMREGHALSARRSEYVELLEGYFCTDERDKLYRRVEDEEKGTVSFKALRLQRAGMPRLREVYNVEGKSDGHLSDETFYYVEWSGRPQQGACWFTEAQLNRGEWLAKFPGIAATSRVKRDFYADVVKSQIDAFGIDVGIARRSTGWHRTGACWDYYWRDGRSTREGPAIPVYGYDFASRTTHQAAWLQHMTSFPGQPTSHDVAEFSNWQDAVSPHGHMTLLSLFAYRSLVNTHVPLETAIFSVADDDLELHDGSSGAGKTTSIDFSRGVDGPCPYRAEPDCKFNGSPAGIETRIAPLHDLLVGVADFHFNGEPTDRQIDDYLDKIDKFVGSVADNAEIKTRANKDMTAKAGTRVGGGLIFDGEKMAPVHLSRLRRMAILQYRRGGIDTGRVHEEWVERQSIHTAIGHAVVRWCHSELNRDYAAFCTRVRTQEAGFAQDLFSAFVETHPDFDQNIARSLAANFARFMTGAWLAEQSTGAAGLVEKARAYALFHLGAHASLIENGGPSPVDREWVIRTTKMFLEYGSAHGLNMDEQPLDPALHGMLQVHGYKRTSLVDTPWQTSGAYLYNLADDDQTYWFRPEIWMDLLRVQARKEHRQWTLNKQTFPSALVKMGIVTPGEDGRSTRRPYVAGKQVRRLSIASFLWDTDLEEDTNRKDEKRAVLAVSAVSESCETALQADGEQDRSVRPLSFAERSGLGDKSHERVVRSSSTGGSSECETNKTALSYKTASSETASQNVNETALSHKTASSKTAVESETNKTASSETAVGSDGHSNYEDLPVELIIARADEEQAKFDREVESVRKFLTKCVDREVCIFLDYLSLSIQVISRDVSLVEPTRAFVAKHEIAVYLVLAERMEASKLASPVPVEIIDASF